MRWFKTGKGIHQGCVLSPCRVHHTKCQTGWSAGWNEGWGEKSVTSDMQMTPPLWCEEELKSLLMKVKEESEKAGLKLNIQNMKIMGSGPVASWQIDGETIETVTNFIFLGSKITVDSEYSHEIKKHLLPWKKSSGKPRQHIKKQRHYFAYKGPHSQSYSFSSSHVWTSELDHKKSWTLKNRCFQTVVLEKTLGSPLDCKRPNQSILKEINPQYSLEGLVLKLKLQYFGHLMWRTDSLEKTLMLGKIEHRRKRAWQRMRWLDGVTDSMDMNLSKL